MQIISCLNQFSRRTFSVKYYNNINIIKIHKNYYQQNIYRNEH